ncbi:YaaL family protein [Lachnoclostridium sp. An118]|uniref:YaaL family protein n=1 Tax=Lachnoclostridium sp. An118 TaxID=1965547 RepID=UPI000B389056|nr:YaaL family protein [Lachnoclostridium sp. An118]OUQ49271.1 hypothetical protein B5E62_11170 [Lachnoclostridium sp. An118]HJA43770.1 YaaL family protein [Candidatus Dorea stercoravium]
MKLFQRGRAAEEDIYKRLSFERESFDIAEELAQARQEIEDAYNNFQNACDPDLIDCYIYRGNAAWKRYCFLLRQAKAIQP